MKKVLVFAFVLAVLTSQVSQAASHRIGGGVIYDRALSDLGEDFDSDSLSWIVSYQLVPESLLLKLEADLEIFPSGSTGADSTLYIPQGYLLVGGKFYGGLGAGMRYYDGDWDNDPIYAIRVGFDLPVSSVHIDLNSNYRFVEFDQLIDDFDTDRITLGLQLRFEL